MLLRLFYAFSLVTFWIIPAGIYVNEIRLGQQSLHWSKTSAVITSHKVIKVIVVKGSVPALRIIYDYVYLDNHYRNDLVRFSNSNRGEKFEDGLTYPVGRSVWVYVNPKRPTQAVLETGVQDISLNFFLVRNSSSPGHERAFDERIEQAQSVAASQFLM